MKSAIFSIALAITVFFAAPACATWSVVKLDQKSKSIVVAGASCSYMVYGIAGVVPGKGVAIVQAASSDDARAYAVEQISNEQPLVTILAHIVDPDMIANFADQQYALLSFAEWQTPLTFTGKNTSASRGAKSAPGFSVQANTMVSEEVVEAAFTEMSKETNNENELLEQAFRALHAGSDAGGDLRCTPGAAASAFISLYHATDNPSTPYLNLVIYGIEPGSMNAVDKLGELFNAWKENATKPKSLQQFMVP